MEEDDYCSNGNEKSSTLDILKLITSDKDLFHPFSNHFMDKTLEKQYQYFCAKVCYRRARWLVLIVVVVHAVLSFGFIIFDQTPRNSYDLLPGYYDSPEEYLQWMYGLIALPFSFWPEKSSPFRTKWKRWVSVIVVALAVGIQTWLTCQARRSTQDFNHEVESKFNCTKVDNHMSIPYFEGRTIQEFLVARNNNLFDVFVAISSTLLSVVGATLAVAVRLDFQHVVVVSIFSAIALLCNLAIFSIRQEVSMICGFLFPDVLLCISCYYSDRTARRSFLANLKVEIENEELKSTLNKAEAALLNDSARDSEKQVVNNVLMQPESRHLEHVRIPFDEIKFEKVIASGGMGEVIKAEYLGTVVVCKRMLRENISIASVMSFRAEIELMSCLRHPNIVQFIGASWDNCSNICMVMEYMENGDVHCVLHSSIGKNFTWSDPLLKMAIDASQGMVYLHGQDPPVIHRDLKSVNLLCSATFGCKVTDFGLSRRLDMDAINTIVGTPFWLAPEVIRNEKYCTKVDVFSFGIVLTELESRKNPYYDQKETGLRVMMKVANEGLRPTIPPFCLPLRKQLILDCLQDDPALRPTMSEVLTRLQGEVRQELAGFTENPVLEKRERIIRQNLGEKDFLQSRNSIESNNSCSSHDAACSSHFHGDTHS